MFPVCCAHIDRWPSHGLGPHGWLGSCCHGNGSLVSSSTPLCVCLQTIPVWTLLPVLLPAVGAAQPCRHSLQRPALQVWLLWPGICRSHHSQQPHPDTHWGEAIQVSNSEYHCFLQWHHYRKHNECLWHTVYSYCRPHHCPLCLKRPVIVEYWYTLKVSTHTVPEDTY